ncbi:Enhancer trap locus-like protein 1 [Cucumispora dikerogammari]|nr:Enhancer trap locus-like protein 1 [Cucumispora dikerogammari]
MSEKDELLDILERLKKKHKITHDIELVYPKIKKEEKEPIINTKLSAIPDINKEYEESIQAHKNFLRKIAIFCQKEFKRAALKTGKTNPLLKCKRVRTNLLKTQRFLIKPLKIMKKDLQIIKDDIENQNKKDADNKLNELIEKSMNFTQQVKTVESKRNSEIPSSLNATLSKYQIEGFNWLKKLYLHGLNGILADDMGLGKTVQSLALLAWISNKNVKAPYLIVTPSCTLNNWSAEISRFLPSFQIIEYWGERKEKISQINKSYKSKTPTVIIMSYTICVQDIDILKRLKFAYVIIDEAQSIKNFNSKRWKALKEIKTLSDRKPGEITANLDELQQLALKLDDKIDSTYNNDGRNKSTKNIGSRLLLSGTPIQNNLTELWALLNFIMPTIFHSSDTFLDWFMKNENKKSFELYSKTTIDKLKTILDPFMLRREKKDILNELPPKTVVDVYLDLTEKQLAVYNEILRGTYYFSDIQENCPTDEEDEETEFKKNIQMHLRKACNHLDLLEYDIDIPFVLLKYGKSSRFQNTSSLAAKRDAFEKLGCLKKSWMKDLNQFIRIDRKEDNSYDKQQDLKHKNNMGEKNGVLNRLSYFPGKLSRITVVPQNFVKNSCKLVYLANLLPKLKAEGHKCLIYFQMTRMITIFESFINNFGLLTNNTEYKDFQYLRLDGTDSTSSRKLLVDEFSVNENIFIFLLSTRAASVGLNLVSADTVIFYDSDWNPTVDMQAEDRVHRIGQTRPVTIYKLKVKNTIEEQVEKIGILKQELMQDVLKTS